jgi:hypothetical protein
VEKAGYKAQTSKIRGREKCVCVHSVQCVHVFGTFIDLKNLEPLHFFHFFHFFFHFWIQILKDLTRFIDWQDCKIGKMLYS